MLGATWWPAFYFDHPRPHYVAAGLVLLALSGRSRSLIGGLVTSIGVLINVFFIVQHADLRAVPAVQGQILRVVHVNLSKAPKVPPEMYAKLSNTHAEIVFFQEATPSFIANAAPDLEILGYRLLLDNARRDTMGSAAFIQHKAFEVPPTASLVNTSSRKHYQRECITLRDAGGAWELLSFHCIRPRNAHTLGEQRGELGKLADWFQRASGSAVAIGDFNTTPWSRIFSDFHRSALLPDQTGWSLQATWPSFASWLGVPIDLAVHSAAVRIVSKEVIPIEISDHAALWVELQF